MGGIVWRYDDDRDCWECLKCGLTWFFNEGSPNDNYVNYCPKCGCPIVEFDMKKTIKEWEKEFNVTILDPDGFDRSDPNLKERLFYREEFLAGMARSTVAAHCLKENNNEHKK